jgi:ATP-dependent protease ClpP protease subunit
MSTHKIDNKVKYAISDPIWQIQEYNIDVSAHQIYLTGNENYVLYEGNDNGEPGVDYSMASRFIKNINILMRNNIGKPILIHMKTCGGDWSEGMAIYNMIQACPNPVTILSYTHARSMSSLIFQAANKRVMMPDSTFMFHDGTYGIEGTVKQVQSAIEFDSKSEERMLDIYTASMKRKGKYKDQSEAWIKKFLRSQMDKKEDVYLTAEEAVEWGLADEIFGKTMSYNWNKLIEYTSEELTYLDLTGETNEVTS